MLCCLGGVPEHRVTGAVCAALSLASISQSAVQEFVPSGSSPHSLLPIFVPTVAEFCGQDIPVSGAACGVSMTIGCFLRRIAVSLLSSFELATAVMVLCFVFKSLT
jgi:hypothetical protein